MIGQVRNLSGLRGPAVAGRDRFECPGNPAGNIRDIVGAAFSNQAFEWITTRMLGHALRDAFPPLESLDDIHEATVGLTVL